MVDHKNDQAIQSHRSVSGESERPMDVNAIQDVLPHGVDPSLTDAQAVADALNVDPNMGLSQAEAERRLAKFGPNELASAPPVPKWKKFLAQFRDPLVYLLLAATAISLIAWFIERANAAPGTESGEILPFDAIVIVLILIVNAVLGYIQESKAEQAVEALSQMTAPQTNVLRDGRIIRINTVDVVPGDIIVLGEGDSVSADGRLCVAASLRIAEASLTGESVAVGKKADTLEQAKALGDRANMVFNGTSVTQGTGRAIVTGTGMNTQVGKIADLLQATEDDESPLQKEMNYVSKVLGIAVCIIAAVVLVALAITEGFNDIHDVIDSLLLAVSLAVAAVPEGLAAILTVVLALGVQRMAMHHAIVKKLHSVETFGSASVICSDKTGTLTRNEMTVERVVTPSGEVQITGTGYAPEGRMVIVDQRTPERAAIEMEAVATLGVGALANDGDLREHTESGIWEAVGDPTEVSLIVGARKVKADRRYAHYGRVGEIPFTSERKRMSIVAQDNADAGRLTVFSKGAPDVLLGYCNRIAVDGAVRPLTEGDRQQILATVERLSQRSLSYAGTGLSPARYGIACRRARRNDQRRRPCRRYRGTKRRAGVRTDLGRHGRHHRSSAHRSACLRLRSASGRHPYRHDHRRPSAHRGSHRHRLGHHRTGRQGVDRRPTGRAARRRCIRQSDGGSLRLRSRGAGTQVEDREVPATPRQHRGHDRRRRERPTSASPWASPAPK